MKTIISKLLLAILLLPLAITITASPASAQASASAQAAALGRSCALPEPFPCPVARIVELTVEPSTIEPGESARITWATENPKDMTISPTIGRVIARGTVPVTPSATTTYTIKSSNGPDGEEVSQSVTLTVRGTQPVAIIESDEPRPIPRMPNGKPDLQGVWHGGAWYIGAEDYDRGGLPRIPTPNPGFEHLAVVDGPLDVGQGCTIRTVPWLYGPIYHFQIVQTDDVIISMAERLHLHRIFQMNAEHSDDVMNGEELSYLGSSVASWDGDTLVIDTRGFNLETHVGKREYGQLGGWRHSTNLHMVERITRINYNTLEIETTLDDPELFEGPWRRVNRHELRPEYRLLPEFICVQTEDFYEDITDGLEEIPDAPWLLMDPTNAERGL
ncbi:MAG: hypothetical protein P8J61_02400 [Gammaproteobacteria bacterium]|jgi:hypothetical protein|nr:hypothetical protein [Gammaproteobacteria bacterium]